MCAAVAGIMLLGGSGTAADFMGHRPADGEKPPPGVTAEAAVGADGGSPLYLAPPPKTPSRPADPGHTEREKGAVAPPVSSAMGIPATALEAYKRAAGRVGASDPQCALTATLLAAIGQVESNHADGGNVTGDGRTLDPILGPRLNGGPGVAAIPDTDDGTYDQDPIWDRAVGPMQFIPSTWRGWAADGNGDDLATPHNIFDATLAAGRYLCAGGRNLSQPEDLRAAILSYNPSSRYLSTVLAWMRVFTRGVMAVPDAGPGASGAGGRERTSAPPRKSRESRDQSPGSASSDSDQRPTPSAEPSPHASSTPAGSRKATGPHGPAARSDAFGEAENTVRATVDGQTDGKLKGAKADDAQASDAEVDQDQTEAGSRPGQRKARVGGTEGTAPTSDGHTAAP